MTSIATIDGRRAHRRDVTESSVLETAGILPTCYKAL